MYPTTLINSLCATFSDSRLLNSRYVNEKEFLANSRLHARVCGLLARIGFQLGYLVDFERKFPIDRIQKQLTAEADVSFIDPGTDEAKILLEYESWDAPIYKMIGKFPYITAFPKGSPTIELIGLFITVTGLLNKWSIRDKDKKKEEKLKNWRQWREFSRQTVEKCAPDTREDRERFAKEMIPVLVESVFGSSENKKLSLLIGVFYPNHLQLRLFRAGENCFEKCVSYASHSDGHQNSAT